MERIEVLTTEQYTQKMNQLAEKTEYLQVLIKPEIVFTGMKATDGDTIFVTTRAVERAINGTSK